MQTQTGTTVTPEPSGLSAKVQRFKGTPGVDAGALRELRTALDDLKTNVGTLKRSRSHWMHAFWAIAAAALLGSGLGYAAISSNTNTFSALRGDVFTHSESLYAFSSVLIDVAGSAISAAGTTQGAAIEITTANPAATEAVAQGNWYYQATVAESAVASVTSGTYKLTLYLDGTSQGDVFITQATSDAANAEGAKARWDLGASLTATAGYSIKIVSV